MTKNTRVLERRELRGRDGDVVEMDLVLLGEGSSYQDGKDRWFEVKIFADANDNYVVYTVGKSKIPGEHDRSRIEQTSSPYDVVEILTVRVVSTRQAEGRDRRAKAPYVPRASARALAQAAEFDNGLNEVYLRMVA